MQYENRTDFRAFDVMVHAIDNASRDDIRRALKTAEDHAVAPYVHRTRRVIWGRFAALLRETLKDY